MIDSESTPTASLAAHLPASSLSDISPSLGWELLQLLTVSFRMAGEYLGAPLVEVVQGHKLVLVIPERVLQPLHHSQHFLLLQPAADYLHTHRQPIHALGIVVLVRPARNPVQLLCIERGRESVQCFVHVGDGEDASGIVELETVSRSS